MNKDLSSKVSPDKLLEISKVFSYENMIVYRDAIKQNDWEPKAAWDYLYERVFEDVQQGAEAPTIDEYVRAYEFDNGGMSL